MVKTVPVPDHFLTGVVGNLPDTRPIFYGCRSGLPDTRSIFTGAIGAIPDTRPILTGATRVRIEAEITLKTSLTPSHEQKNHAKEMISPKFPLKLVRVRHPSEMVHFRV